jgi:SMP-30/Gluconolactonase/LRE-like region
MLRGRKILNENRGVPQLSIAISYKHFQKNGRLINQMRLIFSTRMRMQRLRTKCRRIVLMVAVMCLSTSVTAHPGSGIAVDRIGQVYFLDTGSGLWKIDAHGKLTHLSGTLFHWLALDVNNAFANTQLPSGAQGELLKVGTNPTVLISSDYPIAVGQDGNLYYPSGPIGGLRIMKMNPSGATSVLANLPGTVKGESLPHIGGIAAGPNNSMYYTEDSAIRKITAQGRISTVATVRALVNGPSIPATDQHPYLRGLAVDARGDMYVADSGDARVLKITPDGKVTTVIQTQSPWSPTAVALFGSDVFVLEFLHTARDVRRDWLPRVRKIASDGKSMIIATVDQMPGAR